MNNKGVSNLVRETLKRSGVTVSSDRLDETIRQYMIEREELDNEVMFNKFDTKTIITINDMVDGLNEIITDLNIIKTKDGDVYVDDEIKTEDYIEQIVDELSDIQSKLNKLKGL